MDSPITTTPKELDFICDMIEEDKEITISEELRADIGECILKHNRNYWSEDNSYMIQAYQQLIQAKIMLKQDGKYNNELEDIISSIEKSIEN